MHLEQEVIQDNFVTWQIITDKANGMEILVNLLAGFQLFHCTHTYWQVKFEHHSPISDSHIHASKNRLNFCGLHLIHVNSRICLIETVCMSEALPVNMNTCNGLICYCGELDFRKPYSFIIS